MIASSTRVRGCADELERVLGDRRLVRDGRQVSLQPGPHERVPARLVDRQPGPPERELGDLAVGHRGELPVVVLDRQRQADRSEHLDVQRRHEVIVLRERSVEVQHDRPGSQPRIRSPSGS